MKRTRTLAALLLATAATAALAASSTAAPARTQADIVGTATANGQFTTLTSLLKRAGLVATLKKAGPYTVFAPTDAAFAKVPKKTIDALLADKAKLKAVLLYHVVPGKVMASDAMALKSAKTAGGKTVGIRSAGMNVFVGGAKVTAADVAATNGVIHVINKVLIPPAK
jgi:uncharacterized surface protein with fasciclin (FAS1) repeats